jgi:hypothetical protein
MTAEAATSPSDPRVIEVHVRDLAQLFNSMDPSPFRERDLGVDAEEYIVETLKERPSHSADALLVRLDSAPVSSQEQEIVCKAIQAHFARQSQIRQLRLKRLLRRGAISLSIGTGFLVTFFLVGELMRRTLGETPVTRLVSESLVIGGWVALWRPLEIFLYDWWPIVGERRIHERLSKLPVRLEYGQRPASAL